MEQQKTYRTKREMYSQIRSKDISDFLSRGGGKTEAVPCSLYPGYYYIPETETLVVINKEGGLIGLITGKKLRGQKLNGYNGTWLRNNGVNKQTRVHRILAKLFVDKPERHKEKSFDELEVNHKNGIKTYNDISNLEWVTSGENSRHAWDAGLAVAWKSVGIIIRDKNGDETKFKSAKDCAAATGVDPCTLWRHLYSPLVGRITANGYYFKIDNDSPWPDEPKPDLILHKPNLFVSGVAKNVETNKTIAFCYLRDVCSYLGISVKGLNWSRGTYGKDRPYYGWIFYNRCDNRLLKKKPEV